MCALGLVACGSRTSLDTGGSGSLGGGGTTSTTSSTAVGGAGGADDACDQAIGSVVVATLPPGPKPDRPSRSHIHGAAIWGDTLYFANYWSLYAMPKCGGPVTRLYDNPKGGFYPDISPEPFGEIATMTVGAAGIYFWISYDVDGPNAHLWHTALDGSFTVEVPTAFAYPALESGPGGVFLVDPAIRRINPDDSIDYLGSAAPLDYVSLPVFDQGRVYFSGAIQDPLGPLFSIPLGGGELEVSAFAPWLREIAGDGNPFYGLRAGDPSAIVEVAKDGAQTVLVDDLPWDASDLHLLGDKLVFAGCEAVWSFDPKTGALDVVRGEPDCYPLEPDEDPIFDHAPRAHRMAVDGGAFYAFEKDQVVRVRVD